MTTKVLDATTISVGMGDIKTIDLIQRCSSRYPIVTTREVRHEIERGFAPDAVERAFAHIRLSSVRGPGCDELVGRLKSRFPFLHEGELTSFVLALVNYEREGEPFYYVTDDRAMRRCIERIVSNDPAVHSLGLSIPDFKLTGTVGLIMRLFERGSLTKGEMVRIARELETGTFRVTDSILRELKERAHEA